MFGGSFDPPGNHHVRIVTRLAEIFNQVIVIPCGPRPDRKFFFDSPDTRRSLAEAAFSEIDGVTLDLSDIELERFTYTFDLDARLKARCSPVHVIGADLVIGGSTNSPIVKSWHRGREVWDTLEFLLLTRPSFTLDGDLLPPHSSVLEMDVLGSSTAIRKAIAAGEPIAELVPDSVCKIIDSIR